MVASIDTEIKLNGYIPQCLYWFSLGHEFLLRLYFKIFYHNMFIFMRK